MKFISKIYELIIKTKPNFKHKITQEISISLQQMKFVNITQDQEYEEKILPQIKKLVEDKLSIKQVLKILRTFKIFSTMKRSPLNKGESHLTFKSLIDSYGQQIPGIFSQISKIILQNKQPMNFDILESHKEGQINFNKKQMVYLMCLMALNLVPYQQYDQSIKRRSRFPNPNQFSFIFDEEKYKTHTIIEYFRDYFKNKSQKIDQQTFTIRRQVLKQSIDQIVNKKNELPMQKFIITQNQDSIQNYFGDAKVDFANKYIGGGALHTGCVQQEIMFSNHPELFTSVIFCEVMEPNQSLFLAGYKKYSINSGYAWTTKYDCQQKIQYPIDEKGRAKQYIVAIDAIHFGKKWHSNQAQKQLLNRELLKAYVGFNIPEQLKIITGNWGCGAFNGQVRTKFIIQWLACSLAQKQMIYCPFGSKQKLIQNQKILNQLSTKNVGQVYNLLINGGKKMDSMKDNIFQKISQLL